MLTSLDNLIPSFDIALEGIKSINSGMESTKGFSRDLNFAADRSIKALNALGREIAQAKEIRVAAQGKYAAAASAG